LLAGEFIVNRGMPGRKAYPADRIQAHCAPLLAKVNACAATCDIPRAVPCHIATTMILVGRDPNCRAEERLMDTQTSVLISRPNQRRAFRASALSIGLFLWIAPSFAQDRESPFAPLAGAWTGSGTITLSSGAKERIRCQANYRLGSATATSLKLTCASDSYKFELESDVVVAPDGALSGIWSETTRHVAGRIVGRMTGSQIAVRAEGQTFSALMDITTRGSRQSVYIRAPGSEMSGVSIALDRRSR
jgi:hypothetical protein